jgi:hypothetical protein
LRSSAVVLGVLLAACELEEVAIPRTETRVALHGVLSATATNQAVLIERTRTGAVASFDLDDPVLSAPLAETNALVELTTPSGQVLQAVEDKDLPENKGQGSGIYRFALDGSALVRGATYRIRVQTSAGGVLTAETSVPDGVAEGIATPLSFDRSKDTLSVQWQAAPGARSYFVRIETPFGPRSFFTDSTRIRLVGDLRNTDDAALPRVFVPGFPQAVTVSAVDSNYYDWYRTHNARLTGAGVISRIQGGIGVFGALVRLRFLELRVVTPQTEPVAGVYDFEGTQFDRSVTPNLGLTLYLESSAARTDQADAVSGSYDRRPFLGLRGCLTCGLLGTVKDGRVEFAMLRDWFASDTADVFTGEIRGDTIVGTYRFAGGPWRYVRQ